MAMALLERCANPVSPTGGPKDVSPPEAVRSEPPMHSVNFSGSEIRILFDEFIRLEDVTNQLIVSPPLDETPVIKTRGKSVIVEFREELSDNTTYNIFFGDAIVDITEGNPARNFRFAFSTGPVIDSMSYNGRVLYAFDLEPPEGEVFAMLYLLNNDTVPPDSMPLEVKPFYLTKPDEEGYFSFSNLKDEPMKLFALKDANSNLIYDLPNEEIAFADTLIIPQYPESIEDTTAITNDTVDQETTFGLTESPGLHTLYMFREIDSTQQLLKAGPERPGLVLFVYKFPALEPRIMFMDYEPPPGSTMTNINRTKDTLFLWLRDFPYDSLICRVFDGEHELDTAAIRLTEKSERRKKDESAFPALKISNNLNGDQFNPFLPLRLGFNYPVERFRDDRISILAGQDTISAPFIFTDTIRRNGHFIYKWKENEEYTLIIPDSTFTGFPGNSHDSLKVTFNTMSSDDFGNFFLEVIPGDPDMNYIIQLMTENGNEVMKRRIDNDSRLEFPYLMPGNYKVKAVADRNSNGRWDTGDYSEGLQPEKVLFFPKSITIRAAWDLEESWQLVLP